MVGAVVGDLGAHRRPRRRLADVHAGARRELGAQPRGGIRERHEGAERIEQDGRGRGVLHGRIVARRRTRALMREQGPGLPFSLLVSRRERQRRRRRHHGHPFVRGLVVLGLVLFAGAGLGVLGVVGWVVSVAESAPSLDTLKPLDEGANSVVYTRDGKRLGFINSLILRSPDRSSQIPQAVKDATVAIEDRRFYKHKGVDYEGVVRAAVRNFTSHKTVQGGSTLTMQLVRNIYLTDERSKKSFTRKIREAKLAEELESRHPGTKGKSWILTKYLNSVPYGTVGGQTAVGVEAASRMYFDKPAAKLTLAQSALLAGLPQAPSAYNPFLSPADALARRSEVLKAMVTAGMITQARANLADHERLGVKPNRFYTARREQYFFDYVRDELFKRYGVRTVRQGGLKIYTTVDLKMQREARAAIAGQLNEPGDPAVGHRHDRPAQRPHPGHGLLGDLRQDEVQLRHPGATASRARRSSSWSS